MRPDMGKCIIERPRRGSGSALSAKARRYGKILHTSEGEWDYEGFSRLPVSRKQEGYHKKLGDKSFSDLLGPLSNYLRKNCGRPWNDVYSEIALTLGRIGSWGIRHIIREHLDVATCTYRGFDGSVWICDKHGVHKVGGFYYDFYVEPETGILCEAASHRKWRSIHKAKPVKDLTIIPITETSEYRRIKGIWFYQEYRTVQYKVFVGRGYSGRPIFDEKTLVKIDVKKQLSKKQLDELGLRRALCLPSSSLRAQRSVLIYRSGRSRRVR